MPAPESKSDLEDATKKLEQLNRIEEQLARIERETMSRSNSSSEQVNGNQEEHVMEEIQDPDYQLILDAEPSPNTTLDESEQQVLAIKEIREEQYEQEPAVQEREVEPKPEVEPEAECESEPEELPILSPSDELPTEDIEDNEESENILESKIEQDENENIPVKNAETKELEEIELPEVPADVQDDIDKFEELANLVDKSAAELTSNAGSISGNFY